jgi:hypothetical protein
VMGSGRITGHLGAGEITAEAVGAAMVKRRAETAR